MVSSDITSQILAVFKGRSQQYYVSTFISNDNGTSFYLSSKKRCSPSSNPFVNSRDLFENLG